MEIKTYRAPSLQEALAMVRADLGPDAAVLHTREIRGPRLLRWIPGVRKVEVAASLDVNVPSRLPRREQNAAAAAPAAEGYQRPSNPAPARPAAAPAAVTRPQSTPSRDLSSELKSQLDDLQAMLADLCRQSQVAGRPDVPQELFHLFTDLIDAEIPEEIARELVQRVRQECPPEELIDPAVAKVYAARLIEAEIAAAGPIQLTPGQRRVVALVGPTGVGKTTTIAKLAANFRLRERRKVGLITVDTYRIAAVEQLRTYADIINLPMKVVSTPREMREALAQMADLDLVLMDTAGRSPRDEVKIHELKAFLTEAQADEVHLVLSSVAGASTLSRTAERFATVGTTALILTKIDEATGLGNLLPLMRSSGLPLSYLTDGQNVPDDIQAAHPAALADAMLGLN
jgi:flagellar biosynthesis protein FlhF